MYPPVQRTATRLSPNMVLYEESGLRPGDSVAAVPWAQAAMTLFLDETSPKSPNSRLSDSPCTCPRVFVLPRRNWGVTVGQCFGTEQSRI